MGNDPTAIKRCAAGALQKVTNREHYAMTSLMLLLGNACHYLYRNTVAGTNDFLGYRQIRAAFRNAIRESKKEEDEMT